MIGSGPGSVFRRNGAAFSKVSFFNIARFFSSNVFEFFEALISCYGVDICRT